MADAKLRDAKIVVKIDTREADRALGDRERKERDKERERDRERDGRRPGAPGGEGGSRTL